MSRPILVTGGAGYIGSHTVAALARAGQRAVIIDNFCNAKRDVPRRLSEVCGYEVPVVDGDIRDTAAVEKTLRDHDCRAVIHFAGLKAVGESVEKPLLYYDNNVSGTTSLLIAMDRAAVRDIVFSSSATVYGMPHRLPLGEDHPLSALNPYGRSKLMIEEMLRDLAQSDNRWRMAILRYFNPVGADDSGLIGEDPNGIPNNLMPYIVKVAAGQLPQLTIHGDDYATPDGTGVRDYIHVVDLAEGHLAALDALDGAERVITVNLGTGRGVSVREMIAAFERVTGVRVPHITGPRRAGDAPACYADVAHAARVLGWRAGRDLDAMCQSAWVWARKNAG